MTITDRSVTLAEALSMADRILEMPQARLEKLPLALIEETLETFHAKRRYLENCLAKIGTADARIMVLFRSVPPS